jgi:CheY-like chemotaxis protein
VKPILVVDDDDDARELVSTAMRGAGYAVIEESDGQPALDRLVASSADEPCLIILDLTMTTLSGPDFLAVLANYLRLASIPVIVVSGSVPPPGLGERNAVVGMFTKPIDLDALLARVTEVVGAPRG